MKSTTKLLNKMTQVEIWMYWLWGVLWWSFTYSGSTSSVMTMPPWFPHLDATLGNTVLWATLLRESVPCWNLKRQHECLLVQMYFSKTSLNFLTYSWTWIFQTYHHFLKNHWYVKVNWSTKLLFLYIPVFKPLQFKFCDILFGYLYLLYFSR